MDFKRNKYKVQTSKRILKNYKEHNVMTKNILINIIFKMSF